MQERTSFRAVLHIQSKRFQTTTESLFSSLEEKTNEQTKQQQQQQKTAFHQRSNLNALFFILIRYNRKTSVGIKGCKRIIYENAGRRLVQCRLERIRFFPRQNNSLHDLIFTG